MTPRETLRNIQSRRIEMCALEDAVLDIETRLTRISPVLSDMPSAHGNNDKMTDGVARMIELKEKLNHKIDESASCELVAMEMIGQLKEPIHRTILYRLYILNESLQKVSEKINYTYNYTCSLHGIALNEIDKIKTS